MTGIQTRDGDPGTDSSGPLRGNLRRPAFLISAVVVVLLLVAGGVIAITNLASDDGPASPPAGASQEPSTTQPSAEPPTSPSVCGLPGVEMSGTVSRPPDVKWSLVGTTAAPTSATGAGPGVINDSGLRYCFAHTPTGALIAAANFTAMGSVAGLDKQLAERAIAKGPGRDRLLASSPQAPNGGVRVQISGFRVLGYTGSTATIDVAMTTSRGALAGQVYDLVWEDGDWKARVTDQGELLTQIVQLPDLQGYIPWAGA